MVDPSRERLLFRRRLAALKIPVGLGEGQDAHIPQSQHALVRIRDVPDKDVGSEPGFGDPGLAEIGRGLFHDGQHLAGVAGEADEPLPAQFRKQLRRPRRDQPRVKTLVEVHPDLLAAHPLDLFQTMLRREHVVVQENDLLAVRALDVLPSGRRTDTAFLAGYYAPGT